MKTKQLPESWQEVELGDILDYEQPNKYIIKGEILEDKSSTSIPVLTANKAFILGYTNEEEEGYDKLPVIIFDDFTTDNKFVNFKFKIRSSAMKLLTPKTKDVDLKFIFLLIQTIKFNSTTHKRYYLSTYQKIKINLPPLQIQKKIVSILEKAEKLKQKREDADKLTKEYLRSVFYEIFGDPARNKKKFPIRRLEEAAPNKGDFVDGPFGSDLKVSHQTKLGVRILQINNIGVGKFLDKNAKYVSEEKYKELIRHSAFPGDIIIAKMGEPIARTCILPNYINKALVVADCMRLRVTNKKEFDKVYLSFLLNSEFAKKQIDSMTHGSTRIRINLSMIKSMDVPLPPLPLQQKFAKIVEKVEKLKEKQKKSKEEINNLFNSLMQKAFNGELVR